MPHAEKKSELKSLKMLSTTKAYMDDMRDIITYMGYEQVNRVLASQLPESDLLSQGERLTEARAIDLAVRYLHEVLKESRQRHMS